MLISVIEDKLTVNLWPKQIQMGGRGKMGGGGRVCCHQAMRCILCMVQYMSYSKSSNVFNEKPAISLILIDA